MARIFRIIIEAFTATHHLIHLAVFAFVLMYSLSTVSQITPLYINVSTRMKIPSWLLLVVVYLLFATPVIFLWYWQVQRSGGRNISRFWKWCYRQTDRTGTLFLDSIVMLIVVSITAVTSLYFRNIYLIEPTIFLSSLIIISILFDTHTAQRPRRYTVPHRGISLRDIANRLAVVQQLPPDQYLELLVHYNQLDRYFNTHEGSYKSPEAPLPEGMIIQIPPWILPERLNGNP